MIRLDRLVTRVALVLACGCGISSRPPGSGIGLTSAGGSTGEESGSSGGGGSNGGTASGTDGSTGGSSGAGSSGTGGTSTEGTDTGGTGGSGGNPGGKPNGEPCAADSECASDNCYLVPMAGFCAECNEDADCPNGGCQADPLAMTATCTDGALGTMCETDEACGGNLVCTELFDAKGFTNASFCSECGTDDDCPGVQICSPHYENGSLSGYATCVEPGSVPNDDGCPVDPNGQGVDAPCASGICSVADAGGLGIWIGVCGECESSQECGGGACVDAKATLMGAEGSKCQ